MLIGGCHCGRVSVALETAKAPSELPVRTCGCSFCRKHRPRYTSDPTGSLVVRVAREEDVVRYRFGLELADFLICARCGVFVAAVEPERGVLNLEVLERADELTSPATRFEAYDAEDEATRRARRARSWTPARVEVG
jgi:hypothetical protein